MSIVHYSQDVLFDTGQILVDSLVNTLLGKVDVGLEVVGSLHFVEELSQFHVHLAVVSAVLLDGIDQLSDGRGQVAKDILDGNQHRSRLAAVVLEVVNLSQDLTVLVNRNVLAKLDALELELIICKVRTVNHDLLDNARNNRTHSVETINVLPSLILQECEGEGLNGDNTDIVL